MAKFFGVSRRLPLQRVANAFAGATRANQLNLIQSTRNLFTRNVKLAGAAGLPGEMWDYRKYLQNRKTFVEAKTNGNRFEPMSARRDRSDLPSEAIAAINHGKCLTTFGDYELMKSPLDLIIYQQLFGEVKPQTVIEIGAYTGGAAAWMAEMLHTLGVNAHVYSADLDLSMLHESSKKARDVTFIQGNCMEIEKVFTPEVLKKLPHPWVVIEDALEDITHILEYFHQFMAPGDYWIIDDTSPDMPLDIGMGAFNTTKGYRQYGDNEKLRTSREFFSEHSKDYAVDSYYTDFFGYNGTWNWHGYVKRL